ncbi:MAG: Response regulator PleD [Actinobacteria bacterium]|nr:Response regulator PleD [Actinomycetota bacterium]
MDERGSDETLPEGQRIGSSTTRRRWSYVVERPALAAVLTMVAAGAIAFWNLLDNIRIGMTHVPRFTEMILYLGFPVLSGLLVYFWLKSVQENWELKRLHALLEELVITDSLTGLYNQRHFSSRLKQEMERARRRRYPLSLLLLDLDNFKSYNDMYGHLAGDRALEEVGKIVLGSIRSGVDAGFRYGGDEFAVILPETTRQQATTVAQRIRDSLENNPIFMRRGAPRRMGDSFGKIELDGLTTSIGLIEFGPDDPAEAVIEMVDRAMYRAKGAGGGRIEIAGP